MTQQGSGNQASPHVTRVHRGRFFERTGRGFSIPELRQAGITTSHARRLETHVDLRRKTAHAANIGLLKAMMKEARSVTGKSHDERK